MHQFVGGAACLLVALIVLRCWGVPGRLVGALFVVAALVWAYAAVQAPAPIAPKPRVTHAEATTPETPSVSISGSDYGSARF